MTTTNRADYAKIVAEAIAAVDADPDWVIDGGVPGHSVTLLHRADNGVTAKIATNTAIYPECCWGIWYPTDRLLGHGPAAYCDGVARAMQTADGALIEFCAANGL